MLFMFKDHILQAVPSGLTSITGKVIEQLILETSFQTVDQQEKSRSSQPGFTKGESPLTNLITFYGEMKGLVDEGRVMDIAYLEFHIAFDTVHSNTLTETMIK